MTKHELRERLDWRALIRFRRTSGKQAVITTVTRLTQWDFVHGDGSGWIRGGDPQQHDRQNDPGEPDAGIRPIRLPCFLTRFPSHRTVSKFISPNIQKSSCK